MKTSFLALWLALYAAAFAQTVPEPAAVVVVPPAPEPVPPAAQQIVPAPAREQTVYVPFEKLEEVFEKQERGVFLPYREFLELWNKLNLPEKLKEKEPPVEGVLASAIYTGRINGEVAEIKAKLNFEALKEGWSRLKLGAGELSIAEAKSKAFLNFADGGYEILFPAKGAYQLDATLYGKIERDRGRSSVRFHLPKTAVSQLDLAIADKGLEFAITPASAFSTTENPDGSTRLVVYFGASDDISISWTKKIGETTLTPLLFADAALEMRIGAGAVRTDAVMNYRVLRAGVNTFDLLVPADQQVLSVEGLNLREWKLEPAAAGVQKLHATLHTPARENYSLKIKLESALPPLPQQVKLPVVQAQGVERQSGSVSIATDPELVADVAQLLGLTQQAVVSNKEPARGLVGSYRFLRLPYSGLLSVSEARPQIEVTSQTLLVVDTDVLQLSSTFHYSVKKSGIFRTQIELPTGFATAEASGDQIESAAVQKVGTSNVLQIRFSQRRTGDFSFQITAEAARAKPEDAVTVPVFVVQNAERHEAKVGLAIHVSLKSNTASKGDLREEDINNLGELKIGQPERTPLTLGFRYRGAAKPGQVQFELRKSRVSVEVFSLAEVREALIRQTWTLVYNVEYAGVNQFSIEMPKAVGDEVQIDGANIKERTKIENKDAAGTPTGTVTWRVALQEKVLGAYQLRFSHDNARGEVKSGATTAVVLDEVKPLDASRETGQVAVVKDGNVEITKSDATGLELIDPKELGPSLQTDGVFLAYKYAAHPIALRLEVSKNLYLEVPQAVVSYAVLNSVIAEDESETTEVIYWVRNNSQQFFSVQLPGKGNLPARLLSDAFVDGEPQQPSKRPDKNELLIRLPARPGNSEAFPVRFVYEVPSPNPGKRLGWSGHLSIQPPILNDTAVLQTKWTLYLPGDFRYTSFDGPMREPVGRRGWDRFARNMAFFVPQIGPAVDEPGQFEQSEPPVLPPAKSAGFDTQIQHEGLPVTLRRLAAPASIGIAYRGKTYASTLEAFFCAAAFFAGVLLMRSSRQMRFAYFMGAGIGALIISGAVNPRGAGVWKAIYLGAFLSLLVWLMCAFLKKLRTRGTRKPSPAATPPPFNQPVRPVPAAAPPPSAASAPSANPAPLIPPVPPQNKEDGNNNPA